MPDRSKYRGLMEHSFWFSRLGVGCGANNPTPEKYTVMKPPDPIEEAKAHTGL
jgi:hypothetical protein